MNLADLSANEVVMRVRSLNADGNRLLATLLLYMAEFDRRELYKKHACASMFAFCRRLGMSEGSAMRRIESARAVRRFPTLLPLIEKGELHLTTLSIVSSILTPENVDSVIASVVGKSRLEVEEIKVLYRPKLPVKDSIRKMPEPAPPPVAVNASETLAFDRPSPPPVAVNASETLAFDQLSPPPVAVSAASAVSAEVPVAREAKKVTPVVPLREDAYKVQFMAKKAVVGKIERVKEMMRHRNPKGDLATIVDAALDLLIAKLERERFGKTTRPQKKERPCKEGHVSQAKRRELFGRDGTQCTYVDEAGNRCEERGCLEIDHIRAKGRRGDEASSNLRIFCKAHNLMHAKDVYGAEYIESRIEDSRRSRREKSARQDAHSTSGGDRGEGPAG